MKAEINDNVLFVTAIRRIVEDRRVSNYGILLRVSLLKWIQEILSCMLLVALVGKHRFNIQNYGDIMFDLDILIVHFRLNSITTRLFLDVGDIDQLLQLLFFLSPPSSILLVSGVPLFLFIFKDTILLHLVETAIPDMFLFMLLELLRQIIHLKVIVSSHDKVFEASDLLDVIN